MKLTGDQMEAVVDLVNGAFGFEELRRIVRFRLEADLDDVAARGGNKVDVVFQIVDWSMKKGRDEALFTAFMKQSAAIEGPLQKIIDDARRVETVTPGAKAAVADPLARFFPDDQPFVDREQLGLQLENLWNGGRSGVLVVRGQRYTGRSHSWWRIVEVAQSAAVATYRADVSRNPGAWTVSALNDRVASWLGVNRDALKDSLAQGTTQAGALVSALVRHFASMAPSAARWCLVLDGLDRPGIDKAIIELVEELVAEVLAQNLSRLSLIILGYDANHSQQPFHYRILNENLQWLTATDVEKWLQDVAQAAGKAVASTEITTTRQNIFNGLAPPFDAKTMDELRTRVKFHTVDLLRRAP